jgi:hypothetical protein
MLSRGILASGRINSSSVSEPYTTGEKKIVKTLKLSGLFAKNEDASTTKCTQRAVHLHYWSR